MRKSYALTLVSLGMIYGGGHAFAAFENTPQFLPTAGWSVQKNQMTEVRGLDSIGLPCIMATEFDNGYVVRFSGKDGAMLAMAIDFRQDVFTRGRKYDASLVLDGGMTQTLKAHAFTSNTLVFNMRDAANFYNMLASAKNMSLTVEGNPMIFNLGSVAQAVNDLNVCGGGKPMTTQMASALPDIPSVADALPPSQEERNDWNADVTPLSASVVREEKMAQANKGEVWEAKAGDDLKMTMERWATRANVDLDWKADNVGSVVNDITVVGSFEEAVQNLMAQNATATGIDANMNFAGANVPMSPPAPQSLLAGQIVEPVAMSSYQPPSASVSSANGHWNARSGTSLEQVLRQWSAQAGVEFIWQSNQGFAVRSDVASGGSYEDALQSLLQQYTTEHVRPQALLNNDPTTGRRVLIVQSSRV